MKLSVLLIFCAIALVQAGRNAPNFKKWSSCERGREYVLRVASTDQQPIGKVHEYKRKGRTIAYYVCLPCTQCAPGVRQLQRCSTYDDTQCSTTECAVDGCVLDVNFHACRLPGDPNGFTSISAMMDPCDPTKALLISSSPVSSKDVTNEPPHQVHRKKSRNSSSKEDEIIAVPGGSLQNVAVELDPSSEEADPGSGQGWGRLEALQHSALLIVALCVLIVIAVPVVAYVRNSRGQSVSGRGNRNPNEGVIESAV